MTGISSSVTGDIMVVVAKIFHSLQFVYEENIFNQYEVEPLQMVGWEGFYGLIIMSILLLPLSYIPAGSQRWSSSPSAPWNLEDPIDGFIQIGNNRTLLFLLGGFAVSISCKMYGGAAVTKELGATTRMVLVTMAPIVVWVISLVAAWEHFQLLELIGFLIVTAGIYLYKYVVKKEYS